MKRKSSFLCTLLVGCMLFTACGSTTAEKQIEDEVITVQPSTIQNQFQSITQENAGMPQEMNQNMVMGMVHSIDETSITVSTMGRGMGRPNMAEGNMPAGKVPNGERPELPAGEVPNGERPELPVGEVPNGEALQMDGQGMPAAESKTIPVTSTTTITNAEGNQIALSDLTESTMVMIQLDTEGNAVSIKIADIGAFGGNGMGGSGGGPSD